MYKIVIICGFEVKRGNRKKEERVKMGITQGELFPLETSPTLRGSKLMVLAILFTSYSYEAILIKDVQQLL